MTHKIVYDLLQVGMKYPLHRDRVAARHQGVTA